MTLVLAVGVAACTKNTSTSPSPSTTTTTAATTTSTTTSVVTTSIPATFTVSGKVTSAKTAELLRFADIEIIQGVNIGRRFQADGNGFYTMPGLSPGAFVMRVWAFSYLINDVTVTITNSNLTVDVALIPAPPTTTTVPALKANFTWSPNICTIDQGPVVTCTVDGSSSMGNIVTYHWAYAGKDVFNQVSFKLQLGCGDLLGSGTIVTASVRLTVIDDTGNADSLDLGVPFIKLNGVCP